MFKEEMEGEIRENIWWRKGVVWGSVSLKLSNRLECWFVLQWGPILLATICESLGTLLLDFSFLFSAASSQTLPTDCRACTGWSFSASSCSSLRCRKMRTWHWEAWESGTKTSKCCRPLRRVKSAMIPYVDVAFMFDSMWTVYPQLSWCWWKSPSSIFLLHSHV